MSSVVQMASSASPTTSGKYHTPFCPKKCTISHHDLIVTMFTDGRSANGRIQRSGELPIALKQSIECAKLSGWDQNSVIPDAFNELKRPLLFLACGFAKTAIVEGLLRSNFDPKIQNDNGETALHFAANHICKAVFITKGKLTRYKDREDAFERILQLLTDFHPKILAIEDNNGRTALHVSTSNLLSRLRIGKNKRAAFHEFCFKSMIKRLLELEDAAIFTRAEVLEVIKTAKTSNGDSVLHMLAREGPYCIHLLKFVQDLLFSGGSLPDDKNRQNETIVSLAWKTDPRNAVKLFSRSQTDSHQQTSPADSNDQTSPQDISTPREQFDASVISNDNEDSMEVEDVNITESETSANSLPRLTVPLFEQGHEDGFHGVTHSDVSIPYITEAYSLSDSESCLQSGQASDFNKKPKDLIMPKQFEESCADINAASPSKIKTNSDPDDSFLRFVITEGIELDVPAKQNIVRVVLEQYSDKLGQVEDSLPKLGQLISEEETALSQKKEELAMLKKEISAKERSLAEMRRKKEELCQEKTRLKRKVVHCHATQQQLEESSYSKRVRSE